MRVGNAILDARLAELYGSGGAALTATGEHTGNTDPVLEPINKKTAN
jgi:hypothetical protein